MKQDENGFKYIENDDMIFDAIKYLYDDILVLYKMIRDMKDKEEE